MPLVDKYMKSYIIPEYLLDATIDRNDPRLLSHLKQTTPIKPQILAELIPFTKQKLARNLLPPTATFDFSLPQGWVDDVIEKTGVDPVLHFVWLYSPAGTMSGPFPLTHTGEILFKVYNHVRMR